MSVLKFLPEKFHKKWLIIYLIYSLALFGALFLSSALLIGNRIELYKTTVMFLFTSVISFIVCLFGFIGLKIMFSLSTLGLILGLSLMISILFGNSTGWEGLVGTAAFIQMIVFGALAGIIGELFAFARRFVEKNRRD